MQENDAIAVVIPCYNHSNILRRTLKGLMDQTLQPKEVVVVDDGSEDHPEAIVRDFERVFPFTYVRFGQNRGAAAARNEGARRTTASLILFLDADAALVPDALESMARELERHPEAAFVYSNFFWGTKRFRGRPYNLEELKRQNYIHTSSLIRRRAFPDFDESLKKFQDWDLWLTMAEAGHLGTWIDRELYRIEPRKQGMSRWLPKIAYHIPWQKLGFEPKEITSYRGAEAIVKNKHHIL